MPAARTLPVLAAAGLLLTACAGPSTPASLVQARADIPTAISAPPDHYAAAELGQARARLDQAENAMAGHDRVQADRLAQEALADLRLSQAVADAGQAAAARQQAAVAEPGRSTFSSSSSSVTTGIPPVPPAPPLGAAPPPAGMIAPPPSTPQSVR